MQLLHEAESVLRVAGFRTAHDRKLESCVAFEDDTVLGFVAVHLTAESIIQHWREQQDDFLRRNAPMLRKDTRKAWNVYSIFLTAATFDQNTWDLLGIEADVNATRKIVRGALVSRVDIEVALGPIMPLTANKGIAKVLGLESLLHERLSDDERKLFGMLSQEKMNEVEILDWLSEGRL